MKRKAIILGQSIAFFFICSLVLFPYQAIAQTKQLVSLEMDWVMIENGSGFNYQSDWNPYEANNWGLVEKHRQFSYKEAYSGTIRYFDLSWWGWRNESFQNTTLTDGSVMATANCPYIAISLNLHPEWLILRVKNNTNFYVVADLSSLHAFASPPLPNYEDRRYEVGESSISLCNHYGNTYHTVLLPPYGQIEVPYYNNMWKIGHFSGSSNTLSGEDRSIVCSAIENGARIDFYLEMGIFRSDPLLINKNYMRESEPFMYHRDTPKIVYHKYKGPYLKEGSAYYINEDYSTLFNNADMRIQEHIVTKYKKSYQQKSVFVNDYGFLQYGVN